MPRTVVVVTLFVAMLSGISLASNTTVSSEAEPSPAVAPSPKSIPAPAKPELVPGNAGPVIRWDKFYDRHGNPLRGNLQDVVGADSLYFKEHPVLDTLYGCPKSEVPDPTPASCRTAFAFANNQSVICMDPAGTYIYEVSDALLRRHSTNDGTYTDYTITNGYRSCATDGHFVYVSVDSIVYKYNLIGGLVSATTLGISPAWYEFSVANDTLWCGADVSTMNGYACSKFIGGTITPDATWDVGSGNLHPAQVAWDGQYYYVAWAGASTNTFKRFNADRTLSASGTINSSPRGVLCSVHAPRQVTQDSLYWKRYASMAYLHSSAKAEDVTPAQPTPFAWQHSQSVPCMTPDGHYVFEVSGTNMLRTNLFTGGVNNYTLAHAGAGSCGTDGEYVYVPNGTTTRKYTLTGSLVSSTTTDYQSWGGGLYGFGVANDTVWLTPADTGATWYGYACSKFEGGSITHDATWTTSGGTYGAMAVAFDGQYYHMVWGGHATNTFLRFHRDRTLFSSGTVDADVRSVMCKAVCPLMVVTTDSQTYRTELAETLKVASGGVLDPIGTHSVGANAAFPATAWFNDGCRVILEFSGGPLPSSPALVGDSLAEFVDLGGRVVTAMWADRTGNLGGRYVTQYMPFTMQEQPNVGGSMTTVHDPLHPIMDGVSALSVANYVTGNTHYTLRSPNCVCLAEWDSNNRSVAACFDSAGVRLASVGFVPFDDHSQATGQWARLLANAILWVWPGMPAVSVTAPDTGEVWSVGSAHDITWTAANGPITKDSVIYSHDNGQTWNFLDKYTGSRTSYTWDPIPNTPDSNCYVRVFTWNALGQGYGNSGKFQIQAVGIAQPEKDALPRAFALYRPCPNPSAAGAQIRYALPRPAPVELRIYDAAGALVRRLAEGTEPAGYWRAHWNGCDESGHRVAPGVYYCRFEAGDYHAAQKLVLKR